MQREEWEESRGGWRERERREERKKGEGTEESREGEVEGRGGEGAKVARTGTEIFPSSDNLETQTAAMFFSHLGP